MKVFGQEEKDSNCIPHLYIKVKESQNNDDIEKEMGTIENEIKIQIRGYTTIGIRPNFTPMQAGLIKNLQKTRD